MTASKPNVWHHRGERFGARFTEEEVAARAAPAHDETTMPLFDQVKALVVAGAASLAPFGVSAAYVLDDGTDFMITGPHWSEELLTAGANLSVAVIRSTQGRAHGGYSEQAGSLPEEWVKVWAAPHR